MANRVGTKKEKVNALAERAAAMVARKREANLRRGQEALSLIHRKLQLIKETFYEIGEALSVLAETDVYRAMGHDSFEMLLEREKLFARSTAAQLVDISRTYTREQAIELGQSKAYALVRYAAATKTADSARQIVETGELDGRPLESLSAAEITQLRREASSRRPASRAQTPEEKAANAAARAWQASLRRAGARSAVVTVRERDGVLWLDARVRADQAEALSSS